MLIYYFIRVFRKKLVKKLTLGIFGAMLIAYIGHNMFIFDSFNSYLMFFIILGYLSFLFGPTKKELEVEKEINSTKPRTALLIVLALIMIFTIYKTAIIPAKANYAAPL